MRNLLKASLQQVIQNGMTTALGLLKSGKLRSRRTTDRGDLMKFLGKWYEKFDLVTRKFFSDGTVQSVRNEETLRDRSGRLDDISSQEEARPQQFVIGNDETELELSVESRSFVNRVNHQVRKRQTRISNVRGDREEHSMIWRMFMAVTLESAVFMGRITKTIVISLRIPQISHSNKCSTYLRNWCQNKMRSQVWRQLVGKIIHGNTCHSLVTKKSSIFNVRRSTSFRILCCVLGRSCKILNLTKHGSKDWDGSNLLKATEALTESTVSRRNSSGIFSQDLIRCSSATK